MQLMRCLWIRFEKFSGILFFSLLHNMRGSKWFNWWTSMFYRIFKNKRGNFWKIVENSYRTRSEYASTFDFSFWIISMGEQMVSLVVDAGGEMQSSKLDDKLFVRRRLFLNIICLFSIPQIDALNAFGDVSSKLVTVKSWLSFLLIWLLLLLLLLMMLLLLLLFDVSISADFWLLRLRFFFFLVASSSTMELRSFVACQSKSFFKYPRPHLQPHALNTKSYPFFVQRFCWRCRSDHERARPIDFKYVKTPSSQASKHSRCIYWPAVHRSLLQMTRTQSCKLFAWIKP